ncbi:HesA/MoeB/ThiF family protein [Chitinophaga nivalis]|uniref:HesA/MoeB/ThiF family protein n=1 Tax=Chitinophaga nivalis TaxID=2991709 RepID=A0ABT3ITX2_9BACT|nr:HesA/MoeB/ThiF family protein [Chitinophaga nivalis]MCW3462882.1 HesA/MoeB/ThiF family protein [Chitinophaga nivalis]MCW3487428.1 HesA/MoeB/ThiF family protein [Chitinophaga nivalis]
MQRYDRQTRLEGFGPEKQALLQQAKVLVIGAGGLGVPVLQYLTAMGVGTIGIVEHDTVSITNLQRQVLYTTADEGKPKVQLAAQRLQQLNPEVQHRIHDTWITPENAVDLIRAYDVVVDCSDNFGTRYLVNDAAVIAGKPLVYGAIYKYEGQVSVFNYQEGATYRCLFPEAPESGEMLNCSEIGVLGVLPGIIGAYQANETVKVITGIGTPLSNQLLTIDTLHNTHQVFQIIPVAANRQLTSLQPQYEQPVCAVAGLQSLSVQQLHKWLQKNNGLQLLDVREDEEWDICHIPQAQHIPMSQVLQQLTALRPEAPLAVLCHHGMRSRAVGLRLVELGFKAVYNVEGGIHAWAVAIDRQMQTY